jgi:hypothetical protein
MVNLAACPWKAADKCGASGAYHAPLPYRPKQVSGLCMLPLLPPRPDIWGAGFFRSRH